MPMGELPDRSLKQPAELSNDELDPGRLYAVLSYRGDLASWNWAFFVPDPAKSPIGSSGTIFHVVLNDPKTNEWKLEVETRNVISWPLVVAVVRLADVTYLGGYEDVVGGDGLLPIFKTVVIPLRITGDQQHLIVEEFSSRNWFLDAIFSLHECGVVQCDDVWLLERELRKCAFLAMDGYLDNRGWMGYESERCCSC